MEHVGLTSSIVFFLWSAALHVLAESARAGLQGQGVAKQLDALRYTQKLAQTRRVRLAEVCDVSVRFITHL
jgi:hypothetical protein